MVLWWMRSIQVRIDHLLPEAQEEMVEENEELLRPLQDIAVTDQSGGAGGMHSMGDMIQILEDPPTQ